MLLVNTIFLIRDKSCISLTIKIQISWDSVCSTRPCVLWGLSWSDIYNTGLKWFASVFFTMPPGDLSQHSYWTIISGPCSLLKSTWKLYGKKQTGTGVNHGLWTHSVGAKTESVKQHGDLGELPETRRNWLLNCCFSETSHRGSVI